MEDSATFELKLPGFRFHPTEEELLSFYLKNMIFEKEPQVDIIGILNIYRHDPWDLPGLAKTKIGEREWYFFVPRDRRYGSGGRPNRTTEKGFWKATGSDRKVLSLSNPKTTIGLKKTLVFYKGRAPRGCKTDWVMNEFRLPDTCSSPKDIVLCKIYRKATSLKVLEQRAAMEEDITNIAPHFVLDTPSSREEKEDTTFCSTTTQQHDFVTRPPVAAYQRALKEEDDQVETDLFSLENESSTDEETKITNTVPTLTIPTATNILLPYNKEKLPDLLIPNSNIDWTQDHFWTQLRSPWLDNLDYYTNILNF